MSDRAKERTWYTPCVLERLRMIHMQYGLCAYCGRPLDWDKRNCTTPDYGTTEHVTARSTDPRPEWAREVVAACKECNQRKGSRPLLIFLWELTASRTA